MDKPCVYCGSEKDPTIDHVPPKLFLTRPYPDNLITVPACAKCNQSFQKDDEYARTLLCLDVRSSRNSAAQLNLPAVLRSLGRPSARAFVNYLATQSAQSSILDHKGEPMGNLIELDKARISKVGLRFIRALHFVETSSAVPTSAAMKVGAITNLRAHDRDTQEIALALTKFSDRRDRAVGAAFSYVAGFATGISVWFMVLYDVLFLVGTVDFREKDEASRENSSFMMEPSNG